MHSCHQITLNYTCKQTFRKTPHIHGHVCKVTQNFLKVQWLVDSKNVATSIKIRIAEKSCLSKCPPQPGE